MKPLKNTIIVFVWLVAALPKITCHYDQLSKMMSESSLGINLEYFSLLMWGTMPQSLASNYDGILPQNMLKDAMKSTAENFFARRYENETQAMQQNHRRLLEGDFDGFQQLIQTAVFQLPDFEDSTSFGFFSGGVTVTNVRCWNMGFADILINYSKTSIEKFIFEVNIPGIELTCDMDFRWSLGLISDGGRATVKVGDNSAATVLIAFLSQDFEEHPPHSSTTERCATYVDITDINFEGSMTSTILDWMQGILQQKLEDEIDGKVCNELISVSGSFAAEMLALAANTLDIYSKPLESWRLDPTYPEQALQVPDGINLINFNEPEGLLGELLVRGMKEANLYFGNWFYSTMGPDGRDLGINMFLRQNVLDNDRALTISVQDVPFPYNGEIFYIHNQIFETQVNLKSIKIFGLDTFTKFEPVTDVGNYTYHLDLMWEYLTAEAYVQVKMKPSTLSDSIIENPSTDEVIENIKIDFGIDKVDAVVAMLVAIDQGEMEQLHVGPLLFTTKLLPCFLSAFHDVGISGFNVTFGNIREPTLHGFLTRGIDRIITQTVEAAFMMYETVLLRSIPTIFQTVVRDVITNSLVDSMNERQCLPVPIKDDFIDFRDLLLQPDDSALLGGSGDQRYGDSFGTVFDFVRKQFTAADDNGSPRINSVFVRPLTKIESGTEGMLHYEYEFVSISEQISFNNLERIDLVLSDAIIQNLDTVVAPTVILQPGEDPHCLLNVLNFGPIDRRPLNVTFSMMLSLIGDTSPMAMSNKLDISVSTTSVEILAGIFAMFKSRNILQFPLKDILNVHCWFAALSTSPFDVSPTKEHITSIRALLFKSFEMSIFNFSADAFCHDCAEGSHAISMVPDLFEILDQSQTIGTIGSRLGSLAGEILESEAFGEVFDEAIIQAPTFCPHSPRYNSSAADNFEFRATDIFHFDIAEVTTLSAESIDTITFVGATLFQVGFVLLTEAHRLWPVEPSDLLSRQNEFVSPEGIKLLDWTDQEGSVSPILNMALKEIRKQLKSDNRRMLNEMFDGLLDSNYVINGIIDRLIGSDGYLFVPFQKFQYKSTGFIFSIDSVRIAGLNSFTSFNLMDSVAPQTLQNIFHLEKLSFELDISIDPIMSNVTRQFFSLGMEASDINVTSPLFIALDLDLLNSLELGSLIRLQNVVPCLLSATIDVYIQQLLVTVGNLGRPTIRGLMSETDEALSNFTKTVFERFRNGIEEGFSSLLHHSVRPFLNDIISSYIAERRCKNILAEENQLHSESTTVNFVDFRDLLLPEDDSLGKGGGGGSPYGDMFLWVYTFFESVMLEIDPENGLSRSNNFVIGPVTRSQSNEYGTLFFPGALITEGIRFNIDGSLTIGALRVSNVKIEHIDSIGAPLSLLDIISGEAYQLNNTATLGLAGSPLLLSADFLLEFSKDDLQLHNDVNVMLELHNATVTMTTLMKIAVERFANFPVRDLLNFYCWIATIPAQALDPFGVRIEELDPNAAITHLAASVAKTNLKLKCNHCTSPLLADWIRILSTQEASKGLSEAANNALMSLTNFLSGEYAQVYIDRLINAAERRCPHNPHYNSKSTKIGYRIFQKEKSEESIVHMVVFFSLALFTCLTVAFIIIVIRCFVRRRHRRWLISLQKSELHLFLQRQKAEEEKESNLNKMTKSMFCSPAIPTIVRYSIPVIILGNIAFFLSGHLNLGATVNVRGELAGQHFVVEKFFTFSMAKSTIDMWKSGGRALAILILIFSGIWPYTKQLITFVLWFSPPNFVSVSRRGSILLHLDALAKWSMVDIYALVVSLVAFRLSILSPENSFLPKNFYSLELMVVPMWGLYANLIAQLISQISSHFIIHYHRKIVDEGSKCCEENESVRAASTLSSEKSLKDSDSSLTSSPSLEQREQLYRHSFMLQNKNNSVKLVIRRSVNYILCLTSLILSLFLVLGTTLPSMSLEFFGLVGVAIESGQGFEAAISEYSIFGMVNLIMEQAKLLDNGHDYFGLGTLSALFVFCVLIVPLMQTSALLFKWFYPMTPTELSRMSIVIEVLQAWQYTEVFVLSVIVASWQLGPTSQFMINIYCRTLNGPLAMMAYYDILDVNDAQCFQVKASIKAGTYLIVICAGLLALLNTFVVKAASQFCREKENCIITLEVAQKIEASKGDQDESIVLNIKNIPHAPVLFTDTFRWLLRNDKPISLEASRQWTRSDLENTGSSVVSANHGERGEQKEFDLSK